VTPETLFVLFSATKPLSAVCLHILLERGRLDLDDPVARHWPEFARNGKAAVTVRHVLTHSGGFPQHPPQLPPETWGDWSAVVQAMEDIQPIWEPGQDTGYHPLNFGWVVGELVRRIDGRPISQFLREEVTTPLGMPDTYLGLPPELETRVARLYAMDKADPGAARAFNRPDVHQAVVPAGGGIGTARDLARFYAMLAGGGTLDGARILSRESVELATSLQVEVHRDRSLGIPMRWALGFHLGGNRVDLQYDWATKIFGTGAGAVTQKGVAVTTEAIGQFEASAGRSAASQGTPGRAVSDKDLADRPEAARNLSGRADADEPPEAREEVEGP